MPETFTLLPNTIGGEPAEAIPVETPLNPRNLNKIIRNIEKVM